MNVDALAARYRSLVVTACEWRAIGLADPEDMADEVFARLDPRRDHGLRDLYVSIDKVVIVAYQRFSDRISIIDKLRGGAMLAPRAARDPADDFLAALSTLRESDRRLIQLRFWDELDESEAAEVLNLSLEKARERLATAGTRYLSKLGRTHPDLAISDVEDTIRSIKPGVHRRFPGSPS